LCGLFATAELLVESVLLLLTENYSNWTMLDEATACQSWLIFLRHSVFLHGNGLAVSTGQCCTHTSSGQTPVQAR